MKKILLLFLIFGFNTPANAEQYQRHKYTCPESQGDWDKEGFESSTEYFRKKKKDNDDDTYFPPEEFELTNY